jgi:hypothetical protein
MSKYRSRRTVVDGIQFDSAKEARRYSELLLLEKAGTIEKLELQPSIKLEIRGAPIIYRSGRQARYRADFRYRYDGQWILEDCKGVRTRDYKLKDAILLANGIRVVEI